MDEAQPPPRSWLDLSRDFSGSRESAAFWAALAGELRPLIARELSGLPHVREDVIQDTFVSLIELRARGSYGLERGLVPALAASIAKRRCADALRRHYRDRATSLEALTEADRPALQLADQAPPVEQHVIVEEAATASRRAFRRALEELQERDRKHGSKRASALVLRYRYAIAEDDFGFLHNDAGAASGVTLSWSEVASLIGTSAATARQNGFRALRILREIWRRECGEDQAP
jgi:RNA polymerase sigma factor (sigma-70 family)